MVQKIKDLSKWFVLEAGSKLDLPNDKPRMIRLEVNTPYKARLDLIDGDGVPKFLAQVEGRDTIEFEAPGACSIASDAPELYLYSSEGEVVHSVVEAPESFTRIMQGRRTRNPEIEALVHTMNRNFERQLAKQAAVYGELIERTARDSAEKPAGEGSPRRSRGKAQSGGGDTAHVEPDSGTPDGNKGPAVSDEHGTDDDAD